MAKVTLVIDEKEFDKEIGALIKGRIKQVLRNDKFIGNLITTTVASEVSKRVDKLMKERSEGMLKEVVKTLTPNQGLVIRELMKEIREQVSLVLTGKPYQELLEKKNKITIASLFEDEIKSLKSIKKKK
jgi:hypothetical protein